jgi:hypothetical protein
MRPAGTRTLLFAMAYIDADKLDVLPDGLFLSRLPGAAFFFKRNCLLIALGPCSPTKTSSGALTS